MNSRPPRAAAPRPTTSGALVHRGPQAMSQHHHAPLHAPNAALLIDFDNVTMGIQKDLHAELKALLSSEMIRGKVAVQRAYADWRRYPQYIVPLAESSIDMIMAPAYGSSKKNATDIRLAIDALELVFTRPEIGTFILLSGDSDFSSLVIKLKEYGKYVIGVGIRESSSDLLVMNCDEYYSYNALTGLVKSNEDEPARKWDPWELVTEAVGRMKRNGDVMRSDRLKQVMQEIDSGFDEKNLGMAKFSRFCQEAASRGLLTVSRMENGQLEVDVPGAATSTAAIPADASRAAAPAAEAPPAEERAGRRSRRGRGRGRDRDRDREDAARVDGTQPGAQPELAAEAAAPAAAAEVAHPVAPSREERPSRPPREDRPRHQREGQPRERGAQQAEAIGVSGERLTRDEAFGLVRRAVERLTTGDDSARASAVRHAARELLGRDSESLSERNFTRILGDAHDANIIDLRRRGDDFEVARAAEAAPVRDQLAQQTAAAPAATPLVPAVPRGMGPRGGGRGRAGRPGALPPELLSIGIVAPARVEAPAPPPSQGSGAAAPSTASVPASDEGKPAAGGRKRAGAKAPAKKSTARKSTAKKAAGGARGAKAAKSDAAPADVRPAAKKGVAKKAAAGKRGGGSRARKSAAPAAE